MSLPGRIWKKPILSTLSSRGPANREESGKSHTLPRTCVLKAARLYDERTSLDPVYPAMKASREDVDDVLGLENSAIEAGWETGHAPPGSVSANLYWLCQFDD